jgi:fructosamine-3-kinase
MLTDALSSLLRSQLTVVDVRPLSGGCISEVAVVTIRGESDRRWQDLLDLHHGKPQAELVVKRNSMEMVENFRCEAEGLRALGESGVIRVPKVYATGVAGGEALLAIEWIEPGRAFATPGRFTNFGRQLARLHRETAGAAIGWANDNYLGSAQQPNRACRSWPEFVAQRRIGFQIRWAADQGLADRQLQTDCQTIITRMHQLLGGRDDSTSLLHGDLWSGNYLFDAAGQPVLIDPAVYRGCREAEWGMITWFGGCPGEFERAYQDEWPMPPGWRDRVAVYRLYHQLNHLNLFGGSYAGDCRRTAAAILRSAN